MTSRVAWAVKRLVVGAAAAIVVGGLSVAAAPVAGASGVGFPTVAPYGIPRHPSHNISFTPPESCRSQPRGAACQNAAIYDLDVARRQMGLHPYKLPKDFLSLTPAQQSLILVDLDRSAYREPVVHGINPTLVRWAGKVIPAAPTTDPAPLASSVGSVPWYAYGGNTASNYPNILFAYESWMYDDGPGSPNVDCTPRTPSRCWGHRDNILGHYRVCVGGRVASGQCQGGVWKYLAIISYGAAKGQNSARQRSFTQLFVATPSFLSPYSYTWGKARAAGAQTTDYRVPSTTWLGQMPSKLAPGQQVTYVVWVIPAPVYASRVSWLGVANCPQSIVNKSNGVGTCVTSAPSRSGTYKAQARYHGNAMVAPSLSNPLGVAVS